jgi:hypothetical protein
MWQRKVRPHLLSDENTRPHTAQLTRHLQQNFSWGTLNHPQRNPDLAPTDFHVASLERAVVRKRCTYDVKRATTPCMTEQGDTSYALTVFKLITRCD